jgi:hypothetical protein
MVFGCSVPGRSVTEWRRARVARPACGRRRSCLETPVHRRAVLFSARSRDVAGVARQKRLKVLLTAEKQEVHVLRPTLTPNRHSLCRHASDTAGPPSTAQASVDVQSYWRPRQVSTNSRRTIASLTRPSCERRLKNGASAVSIEAPRILIANPASGWRRPIIESHDETPKLFVRSIFVLGVIRMPTNLIAS